MTLPAFIDQVLAATGYRDALQAERSPEAEARLENLEELIAAAEDSSRASSRRARADARGVPRRDRAGGRHRRAGRGGGRRDADDAALGQGARVPGGVPHRPRGGRVSARALDERSGRDRGGAPALLRRHHARPRAALCCRTRCTAASTATGSASPRASCARCPEDQLAPAQRAAGAEPVHVAGRPRVLRARARRATCRSGSGASVRHARFGEGLVVGIERDGADWS